MHGGHVDLEDKQKTFDQEVTFDVESNCSKTCQRFEEIANGVERFIRENTSVAKVTIFALIYSCLSGCLFQVFYLHLRQSSTNVSVFFFQEISSKGDYLVEECVGRVEEGVSVHEKFSEEATSTVASHLESCVEWNKENNCVVNSLNNTVVEFVEEELKRDNPTGNYIKHFMVSLFGIICIFLKSSSFTYCFGFTYSSIGASNLIFESFF